MKKYGIYGLVGILIGGLLGLGIFYAIQCWTPPPVPPVSAELQKKLEKISQRHRTVQKSVKKLSRNKKQNKGQNKENKLNKKLAKQKRKQLRELKKREAKFLGTLSLVYQKVVAKKDIDLAMRALRVFLRRAPTGATRFQVIQKIRNLQILSKDWPSKPVTFPKTKILPPVKKDSPSTKKPTSFWKTQE